MPGTHIPDATDALVARFSALTITDFEVFDGPEFNAEGDFLSVGWTDRSNTAPTTSGSSQTLDYALAEGLETFDVLHLLRIWVNDESFSDARRRIFGYFQQIAGALASDYMLGGAVMQSWISSYELTPFLNSGGGYLDLLFSVTCRAAK